MNEGTGEGLTDRSNLCRLRSTAPLAIPARRSSQGCQPRSPFQAGTLGRSCTGPPAPRSGGWLQEEDQKGSRRGAGSSLIPKRSFPCIS
jgi:hypothetical protein